MSEQTLTSRISAVLEEAGIYVAVDLDGTTISLSGEVESEESRQAAIDVATAVASPAGLTVVDLLEVEDFVPDDAFADSDEASPEVELTDRPRDADVDDNLVDEVEITLEPDFTGDIGTTNARLATEEGDTYFPPTDPVVRPVDTAEELQIVGGFEATAMDDDETVTDRPRNDDEIADDIRRELISDALTTDLTIEVAVLSGTVILTGSVPTIDDAENAEAVASRVSGIVEIREELTIEPAVS